MSHPVSHHRAIRIGCAGWSLPLMLRDAFGEGASVLARYSTCFDAVEINSSFYRSHRRQTYSRWAQSVPDGFSFSVKMPRGVTHRHRLSGAMTLVDRFVEEICGLGNRLGVVLVQLPPSLVFDARVASAFFAATRRRLTVGIACEPRHGSWFGHNAETILAKHGVSRVAANPALCTQAGLPGGSGRLRYWRWHGYPEMYASSYSETTLKMLADQVRKHDADGAAESWIVFDNTARGHATANALRLQQILLGEMDTHGNGDCLRRQHA